MFRLCVLAGISPSTWVRWKQGKGARAASWRAVVEALRKVSPEIADKVDALNHPGAEAA